MTTASQPPSACYGPHVDVRNDDAQNWTR